MQTERGPSAHVSVVLRRRRSQEPGQVQAAHPKRGKDPHAHTRDQSTRWQGLRRLQAYRQEQARRGRCQHQVEHRIEATIEVKRDIKLFKTNKR